MRFTKYTYCTCLTGVCFFFFFLHMHIVRDKISSPASLRSDILKDLADGPIAHAQTTGMPSASSLHPHPEHFFPPL